MTIDRCLIDDLHSSPEERKRLKPGDIVTSNTYASGARLRRGTLIAIVGEVVVVDWWPMSPVDPAPVSAWDGSSVALIADAIRQELRHGSGFQSDNLCERLSDVATHAVNRLGVFVDCTSVTHNLGHGNSGIVHEMKFLMSNGQQCCEIEMSFNEHEYPGATTVGPIQSAQRFGNVSMGVKQ